MLEKDSNSRDASAQLRPLDADISRRIRTCRVLGIFFVIVVHLQPAGEAIPGAPQLVEIIRYFLINVLGHASVPLLSIIGGYLLLGSYESRGYRSYLQHRFNILYLPMIAWNLIFAAALIALNRVGFETSSYDTMIEIGAFNSIFAVWEAPVNGPLYFLRDMFVISIFAPLLVRAIRAAPLVVLIGAGLMVWFDVGYPLIFRPITLFCFCAGLALRMYSTDLRRLDPSLLPIVLAGSAFWIGGTWFVFTGDIVENLFLATGWFDLANRFVVILLFWVASASIIKSATFPIFEWMEKFIYFVFLSHKLVLLFLGGVFKIAFDGYASYWYLALMGAAPLVCVLGAWAALPIIRSVTPALQRILTGRTVPSAIGLPRLG